MPRTLLYWPTRAKRKETDIAHRRIWRPTCGRYRVVADKYKLAGMPDQCRAQVLVGTTWDVISKHHTINAAKKACETHARQEEAIVST